MFINIIRIIHTQKAILNQHSGTQRVIIIVPRGDNHVIIAVAVVIIAIVIVAVREDGTRGGLRRCPHRYGEGHDDDKCDGLCNMPCLGVYFGAISLLLKKLET